jgi:N4-gp56 family major capsid protein
MSVTTPTNVDSSIPELWAKLVLREHLVEGFWGRFVGGEGSGMPIIQKAEVLNKPGDLIHIQTTAPLAGAGVSGDTTALEGSEENLTTSEIKVSPVLYRHAVRVNRRANKKSILDLREEARMRLGEWGGEKMDDVRFNLFLADALPAPLASETYNAAETYFIGGDANPTVDEILVTDTLTVESIQVAKLNLKLNKAKPVMIGGKPYYVMVTHPYALHALKRETEYRDWVREAHVRGGENPFFAGSTAIIDGVVIFDHPNVPRTANAGAVQYATSLMFGREFAVEGVDENPSWAEDEFDYGLEFGIAYSFAFQPRRALELSSLRIYSAAPTV